MSFSDINDNNFHQKTIEPSSQRARKNIGTSSSIQPPPTAPTFVQTVLEKQQQSSTDKEKLSTHRSNNTHSSIIESSLHCFPAKFSRSLQRPTYTYHHNPLFSRDSLRLEAERAHPCAPPRKKRESLSLSLSLVDALFCSAFNLISQFRRALSLARFLIRRAFRAAATAHMLILEQQ